MKKILAVYTGGTICTCTENDIRVLNLKQARRTIVNNYINGSSRYAADISDDFFVEAELDFSTLSENLTISKLNKIIDSIKQNINREDIMGVIVLHGTDTLAYSSAILSLMFQNAPKPIMLVSANRPANEDGTNANDNFCTAVELIIDGIAPNIYVPYRNSDGKMWLHLAATLMQCPNISENFRNANTKNAFLVEENGIAILLRLCSELSEKRLVKNARTELEQDINAVIGDKAFLLKDEVLYIEPYLGLNYERISLNGIKAIIHGTYHSGTVCVGRDRENEKYDNYSILHLCDRCNAKNIPIFISPSSLDEGQYSSVYDAVKSGKVAVLNMTKEMAFAKALLGASCGIKTECFISYMKTISINNEFI